APLDQLHAQETRAEARPVLERLGANADISEGLNVHARPPFMDARSSNGNMGLPGAVGNSRRAVPWANTRVPDECSEGLLARAKRDPGPSVKKRKAQWLFEGLWVPDLRDGGFAAIRSSGTRDRCYSAAARAGLACAETR